MDSVSSRRRLASEIHCAVRSFAGRIKELFWGLCPLITEDGAQTLSAGLAVRNLVICSPQ